MVTGGGVTDNVEFCVAVEVVTLKVAEVDPAGIMILTGPKKRRSNQKMYFSDN